MTFENLERFFTGQSAAEAEGQAGGQEGTPAACCSPVDQLSCCDPDEKAGCCEASSGEDCGCR